MLSRKTSLLTLVLIFFSFLFAFSTESTAKNTRLYSEGVRLFSAVTEENKEKQLQRAIEIFTEVLELDPYNLDAYNSRGVAHYILGSYDEAIEDYLEAFALDPENKQTKANLRLTRWKQYSHRRMIKNRMIEKGTLDSEGNPAVEAETEQGPEQ